MRRKFLQLLGILLLSFSLAGCWDLREAEETGIVVGMGIDQKEDGTIVVIAQTVKPQTPGAGGGVTGRTNQGVDTFQNWYSTGETVYDAVLNLTLKSPNVFFWSHNQVFIISEKLAKKGLVDVMDFIERDPEFKQNAWILIAKEGLPEILESSNNAGQPPSQVLSDIINIRNRNAKYAISSLGDFLQQLGSPNTQPYTAGVTFTKSLMKDPDSVFLPGQEPAPAKELTLSDTAVFNRDKLAGWFNPVESRGLLWIQGKVRQGLLILNLQNQRVSVEITKSSSKFKSEVREGHLIMKVEVKVQGNLTEMAPGIELNEKQVKKIESLMAKEVKEQINGAVTRAQELNTDVLGFAGAVHRDYPEAWNRELSKQWPETFKELEVDVAVESHINGVGLIINSVNPQKIK